jgi:hypothetical protein
LPQFRLLVTGVLPERCEFEPGMIHVHSAVGKVMLRLFFPSTSAVPTFIEIREEMQKLRRNSIYAET